MSIAAPRSEQTCLIVEDERVVAKDLQHTLQALGYRVPRTAASARDAIRFATEERPDLVLIDIRLRGDEDGIDAAQILRARFDVPIVFLTAYADDETVSRAKLVEPRGYLVKPVKPDELARAVELVLYAHAMDRDRHARDQWTSELMASIPHAIVAADRDGHVVFSNRAAAARFASRPGETLERLLGTAVSIAARTAIDEDRIIENVELDGMLASVAPIGSPSQGVIVIMADVQPAALLAHRINNPLTVVRASLALALETLRKKPSSRTTEVANLLAHAQTHADRIGAVVNAPVQRLSPAAHPTHSRARILVVDDEPILRELLGRMLEPEHDVTIAPSSRDALGMLANGRRFDVILCDLMMPDLSGMDLHWWCLEECPDQAARMVFVTGGVYTGKIQEFLSDVPNPRLSKPFDATTLKSTVAMMLADLAK